MPDLSGCEEDLRDLRPREASIIGLRLSWTCVLCQAKTNTHQMITIGGTDPGAAITLPPGWKLADRNQTVCSSHFLPRS